MNWYKNGYVVSELKNNDYTYNVWPLEDIDDDNGAALLTEESDNYETDNSEISVSDNNLQTELLGFDCIGDVYYSYLKNEYEYFKEDLSARGIYINEYGLMDSLEDVLDYINLRQKDINSGIMLEDFWKEVPVKISCIRL